MAAAFLSHAVIYEPASAQTAPMAVDWEHHDRPAFRPGGINYKYVDGVWVVDTDAPPAADARGSGKDWSYSLAKVYEPPTTPGGPLGAHIGYRCWIRGLEQLERKCEWLLQCSCSIGRL